MSLSIKMFFRSLKITCVVREYQKGFLLTVGFHSGLLRSFAIAGLLLIMFEMSDSHQARASVSVSEIGCNEDLAPAQSSLQRDHQIMVDLPISVAKKLQMFVSKNGLMLAPSGWQCHAGGDRDGGYPTYHITLTISPPNDKNHLYGIALVFIDGSSNNHGQELLDPWANAYFSSIMRSDSLMGYGPVSAYAFDRYPEDLLNYRSASIVDYVTPPFHIGVGDDIVYRYGFGLGSFSKTGTLTYGAFKVPIFGFIKLFNYPEKGPEGLELFAITIPQQDINLVSYIKRSADTLKFSD